MIKEELYGKKVKIIDMSGKEWAGIVEEISYSQDGGGENELMIPYAGGLVLFRESDIKDIKVIK